MAVLSKGTTYSDGDQVTSTNLNALVDSATFASGAVDDSTTELSSGAIVVKDGGISPSKLTTGAPSWDVSANGITTFSGDFPTLNNVNFIHPDDDIGALNLSGGSSSVLGAVLWLYGPSHTGTRDNDIEFLKNSTQIFDYDDSAGTWDFHDKDVILTSGDLIITAPTTPASASATGTIGTIAWDTTYFYICIATNTWQRVAHATW